MPIVKVPAVGKPVTAVKGIDVTAAFIPALSVLLTPSETPSAVDLKKVYTAWPFTKVTF